ncbi:beta-glucosidase [Rhodoligotrophos ferricapiens]|uniref:beta-glucosidase n=1 Tax=Rhodoligotrophos ferricapiens TaxID=3069264 RepID=UPI00315CC4D9
MSIERPFRSFFMGGFECSTHRRGDGNRLDLLAATAHDRLAEADYRQLRTLGLRTIRDGLRWHLIEATPGHYDWSSFLPMLRASRNEGMQVIWDLCHYGWPDDIDIFSPAFVTRFARFAREVARVIGSESDDVPYFCPVNEMSFWAWAGGEVARMNPGTKGRGGELKRQLVRASIAAIEAIRDVEPRARFLYAEPAIHVTTYSSQRKSREAAESYRLSQYEAFDLLAGRLEPELGGRPDYLDIIGVNFYPENQWLDGGPTIPFGHHSFRPFREMLTEVHERYGRPVLVSETGAEGSARASWLHYIGAEVRAALASNVPVLGICLYPVLDYPGWDNDRCCEVGLFSMPDPTGRRLLCEAFAEELERQQLLIEAVRQPLTMPRSRGPLKLVADND